MSSIGRCGKICRIGFVFSYFFGIFAYIRLTFQFENDLREKDMKRRGDSGNWMVLFVGMVAFVMLVGQDVDMQGVARGAVALLWRCGAPMALAFVGMLLLPARLWRLLSPIFIITAAFVVWYLAGRLYFLHPSVPAPWFIGVVCGAIWALCVGILTGILAVGLENFREVPREYCI